MPEYLTATEIKLSMKYGDIVVGRLIDAWLDKQAYTKKGGDTNFEVEA